MKKLNIMTFAALDTETADRFDNICSIGVVVFKNGKCFKAKNWSVRPWNNYYDEHNIQLTGITPEMTENAPDILTVWKEVKEFIGNMPVVAHYAKFDFTKLQNDLYTHGSDEVIDLDWYCTKELSRLVFPNMSHKLPDVYYKLFEHEVPGTLHTALDDARACGELFLALQDYDISVDDIKPVSLMKSNQEKLDKMRDEWLTAHSDVSAGGFYVSYETSEKSDTNIFVTIAVTIILGIILLAICGLIYYF